MAKLAEKKLLLFLKQKEDQLREEAQKQLEYFTQKTKSDMETKIVTLLEEKVRIFFIVHLIPKGSESKRM